MTGNFWATDFWASDFWADGFWADGVTPPVPPAATGPQGGGGRRIKWSELFPDSKDPTITRELTKAEGDALFAHAAPTREDAMLLAFLLHSLDED